MFSEVAVKESDGSVPSRKPILKQFTGKTEAIVKKKLREFKKSADYAEKHMPSDKTVLKYEEMLHSLIGFSSASAQFINIRFYHLKIMIPHKLKNCNNM